MRQCTDSSYVSNFFLRHVVTKLCLLYCHLHKKQQQLFETYIPRKQIFVYSRRGHSELSDRFIVEVKKSDILGHYLN
jgi:hypothetical protein